MSQRARENPEQMAEIATLPPAQQLGAMRDAIRTPIDSCDRDDIPTRAELAADEPTADCPRCGEQPIQVNDRGLECPNCGPWDDPR